MGTGSASKWMFINVICLHIFNGGFWWTHVVFVRNTCTFSMHNIFWGASVLHIFVYVQFKNIFFKHSWLIYTLRCRCLKCVLFQLVNWIKFYLFWISVVPLDGTGCNGDTFTCLGDNVVCLTNTCVCGEGYRASLGECVPRKKML